MLANKAGKAQGPLAAEQALHIGILEVRSVHSSFREDCIL